ncbi:MAG: hypothetical protein DYG98_16010, partial [Haliscomenobacteraceae bacterium CHB4]|nr:hypothetical protein [Haliscomenobacteraceae bacterium CHB4]
MNNQTVQDTFYQPAQPLPAGDTIYVRIVPYNGLGDAIGCQEYWFVTAGNSPFTPEMVPVAGGTFTMGCTPEQILYCEQDEDPAHPVTLPGFEIGKYEVTQMEWQALMSDINPTGTPEFPACGGACPIEKVSWYDAVVYCNRLSEQEGLSPCYYSDSNFTLVYGKNGGIWSLPNGGSVHWNTAANGYRLPTEAEWEYTARGGTQSQGYLYAGSDFMGNVAWVDFNSDDKTHPVGTKLGNELDLFDMSGNVWEWTWDVYDPGYYAVSPTCVPTGPDMGPNRVYRGGSWFITQGARVAYRSGPNATTRVKDYGFRLARGKIAPGCTPNLTEPAHASVNIDTTTLIRWPGTGVCVEGYHLSLGTAPGGSDILDHIAVQDTFYQPAQPLPAGDTVFARVVPYNGAGNASGCQEFWFVTTGSSPCNRLSDSLELVKFYNSTGGPTSWINKWDLNQPMNTWFGVGLTHGCVSGLFLQDNNLNGLIPDSFGALSTLESVDLQNNNLGGPLPSTVGNLKNLEMFYIRNNPNISGTIPTGLTNCTSLKVLSLAATGVEGNIPPDIDKLVRMNYLLLDETKMSGPLPNALGSLKEMVVMTLNNSQFNGPLPDLSQMSHLQLLWLQNNKIDAIPLGAIPLGTADNSPHDTLFYTSSGYIFTFGLPKGLLLQNNALTFDDLLPLDPPYFSGSLNFPYAPQDSVFHDTLIMLDTGQDLDISLDFDENIGTNVYYWYKDGVFQFDIIGNNNLTINNLQAFHAGEWRVQVTNMALLDLTLYSRAIRLQVNCTNIPAPVITGPLTLCDGSATLTVSGTYPQLPQWSNNTSGQSTTVNTPGIYTVTVTDAIGCTGTATWNVGPNTPSPQPDINGPTALCGGSPTLSVSGTYPQNPQWSNGQTGYSITVNLPGAYSVTVTDANGCTGTDSQTVSNQGPPMIMVNTTPAGCNPSLGSINLMPTGAAPFTFDWADLPGTNDPEDRNNLSAGQYSVTVTDANGCAATSTATIGSNVTTPPANVSASPAAAQLTCTFTSIQLTATGGPSYQWSNGLGTAATVNVTTPETYTVTVTGGNGCTATATQNVTQDITPPAANILPPATAQLTCTLTSIQLTATGGLSYQWSNGLGTAATVNVTAPGTYTVTVTGGNGCTAVATKIVTQNINLPVADISPTATELTCTVVSITLTAGGGGAYQWSGNLGTSNTVIVNSPAVYTVTVTDPVNGCTAQTSVAITQNAQVPVVTLTAAPSNTLDCNHPTITLTATGGGTYLWSNGLGTGATAIVGAPGNYTVTVTLPNGCSNAESIEVMQDITPPTPAISMDPPGGLDCGGSTVTLTVNGFYNSYQWSDGQNTPGITVGTAGTYSVTVTSANGCTGITSQTVNASAVVTVQLTEKLCPGGSIQIGGEVFDKNNPSGEVIVPGVGGDCDTVFNVTVSFYYSAAGQSLDVTLCPGEMYDFDGQLLSQPGLYRDTFFNQAGCDSIYFTLKLAFKNVPPFAAEADSAVVTAGESLTVPVMDNDDLPPGGGVALQILTQPDQAVASLSGTTDIEISVPDIHAVGYDSMHYILCHTECPAFCDTAPLFIRILPSCLTKAQAEIPTVITPNGDGLNDEFDPLEVFDTANCVQIGSKSSLVILNRWGEVVFRPGGYEKWDG